MKGYYWFIDEKGVLSYPETDTDILRAAPQILESLEEVIEALHGPLCFVVPKLEKAHELVRLVRSRNYTPIKS